MLQGTTLARLPGEIIDYIYRIVAVLKIQSRYRGMATRRGPFTKHGTFRIVDRWGFAPRRIDNMYWAREGGTKDKIYERRKAYYRARVGNPLPFDVAYDYLHYPNPFSAQ